MQDTETATTRIRAIGSGAPRPRIAFVSTYPPTVCGLASFTSSLRASLAAGRGSDAGLDVVELTDESTPRLPGRPEVVARLNPEDAASLLFAAERLTGYDGVILQHEYGIWGSEMGRAVVDFTDSLGAPVVTTLHTLLQRPTRIQEWIIRSLADRSEYVVVPTRTAHQLLTRRYRIDDHRVAVIPHGTRPLHSPRIDRSGLSETRRPRLLTWGLIGPGKGLEWSLRALSLLRNQHPDIRYTIAGRTHPKVLEREGERYRSSLISLADSLDLGENVDFVDGYLSVPSLEQMLEQASVVVLPYDSTEQIVSGVLVEAVSANVPVVATSFPHAVELAQRSAVSVVPHRDPRAMAKAIDRLLASPGAAVRMLRAQSRVMPDLDWGSVALQYERLLARVVREPTAKTHVPPAS